MRARFEAEGDVIVVTGGGNGIGQALARGRAGLERASSSATSTRRP
jgi:hypothetical protein